MRKMQTQPGNRTQDLWHSWPAPYPLGHRVTWLTKAFILITTAAFARLTWQLALTPRELLVLITELYFTKLFLAVMQSIPASHHNVGGIVIIIQHVKCCCGHNEINEDSARESTYNVERVMPSEDCDVIAILYCTG